MTQGSSARLEQAAHNRQVAGSNPAPATKFCSLECDTDPRCETRCEALYQSLRLDGLVPDVRLAPDAPVEVAVAPEECSPWNILAAALLLAFSAWMLFVLVLGAIKILQTYPGF